MDIVNELENLRDTIMYSDLSEREKQRMLGSLDKIETEIDKIKSYGKIKNNE